MKRCTFWLLHFVQGFCILLGFTTIVIDFKRNRLNTYKTVKIYVTLINIYVIYLIVKTIYSIWQTDIVNITFEILFSTVLVVVARVLLVLFVVGKRRSRDKILRKFLKEIFYLQEKYFIKYANKSKDTKLRKLWLLSSGIFLLHIFNFGFYIYKENLFENADALIELHEFSIVISMQQIIMLHHTFILCYIYESFSFINQLLPSDSSIITYFQLCELLNQVNKIYSPLIFCLQLKFLVFFSTYLFMFIIFFDLIESFAFFLYGNFYFFLMIHIFIYFFMCHKISEIESETNFFILHIMGVNDNRELEQFCLIRKMQQIAVNVYGVFKIDLSFLFVITANILQYTIILLQIYMQYDFVDDYY
ncbi:uncharacterized protein ACRADG_010292 [Cochliomyia hominivorax]